jgi:sarcosine oxidase subunit gamma
MAERVHPLADYEDRLAATMGTVQVRPAAFLAQVGLRVDPASAGARRVAEALAVELPANNRVAAADGVRVLWLGPDEWLVVGADGDEAGLVDLLERALDGDGAVVDLSGNRCGIALQGPQARDLLATCCSIDLHPRVFGPGHCAQTLLQKAPVLIEQTGEDAFLLLVRPSFAAYVAEWLLDGVDGFVADVA